MLNKINKLSWIINSACNLRCIHCYPNSGVETRQEFSSKQFGQLRANLSGMHFSRTFLSGGEPVLDKNFFKYLEIANDISDEVYICSNGTTLSDSVLDELVRLGVKGIVLSYQANDAETAYIIYGNSLVPQMILETIRRIQKYDIVLGVETTLLRQNISSIDDLIKTLIAHDVKFISFKRLLPIGRGQSEEVSISKEENYEMLARIADWQISHKEIRFHVHDPLYGTIWYDKYSNLVENKNFFRWLKGFSCRAGTRWIGIDPFGNVSPCPLLLYRNTIIGNVLKVPLKELLEKSSLIRLLQDVEKGQSKNCKYGSVCLGCRATAITKNNSISAKDPMCVYANMACPIVGSKED